MPPGGCWSRWWSSASNRSFVPSCSHASLALFLLLQQPVEEPILKAVEAHFTRYGANQRADAAKRIDALWRKLPDEGDLRDRGLMRIVRTIESATHLFPRDQEWKDLRTRHPGLPEFAVPERFHLRAYELALKKLTVILENAAAFPSRTAEGRAEIADQIGALMDRAGEALRGKAADEDSLDLIEKNLRSRRDEFLQAMDDPFAGYLKALEDKAFAELQDRMLKQIAALPALQRNEMKPSAKPHRPPVRVLGEGVGIVRQIPRAYDPSRFAVYDEDDALVDEVHRDWAKQRRDSEALYLEKAREEKEQE